jgi:hypothetical protein
MKRSLHVAGSHFRNLYFAFSPCLLAGAMQFIFFLSGNSQNTSFNADAVPLYGGSWNTAIGIQTMARNIGNYNIAIGANTLQNNLTGSLNVAIGYQSMYTNINGHGNTALGEYTLFYNTSGGSNTALGGSAETVTLPAALWHCAQIPEATTILRTVSGLCTEISQVVEILHPGSMRFTLIQ